MKPLLDNATLEWSSVVANSAMNRERGCVGSNSYAKDLRLNPLEFLTQKLQRQSHVAWLDICCGTGKALIEAASHFQAVKLAARVQIVGIDLVSMFLSYEQSLPHLALQAASILTWEPAHEFDLITCVHGLHYIGDKLLVLQKAAACLTPDGLFMGHIDLANLRRADGTTAGKEILNSLRKVGFQYDPKWRVLSIKQQKQMALPYQYLGADDKAGPNYTGQPAVHSYYRKHLHA